MRNLVLSFGITLAVFYGFSLLIGWWALFPAVLAMMGTNYLLSRSTQKRLERLWPEVTHCLQSRRFDQAVKLIEEAKHETRHQLFMGKLLDAQIGMILYGHKQDFDAARPYLERATVKNWQAQAMLGAYHFKKKDYEAMEAVFERACKKNKKKAGMLWATYAWCQHRRGKRDKAVEILSQALKHQPDDDNLKACLHAVQNDKRMRMKRYEPEWWAMHLERVPQPTPDSFAGRGGLRRGGGRKGGGKGGRRGRKKR